MINGYSTKHTFTYICIIMQVKASDIDYTQLDLPVLKRMEEDRLYPPRYIVSISGTNAHKAATLILRFTGSVEDFTAEVLLEPTLSKGVRKL